MILPNAAFAAATIGILILWNETPASLSFVWTSSVSILIALAVALARPWDAIKGRGALIGAFFLLYPLLWVVSYWLTPSSNPLKEDQIHRDLRELVFAVLYFFLGYCIAPHVSRVTLRVVCVVSVGYVLLRQEVFSDAELFYQIGQDRGVDLNYQHLGDAFAVSAMLLLGTIDVRWMRALVVGIAIASLSIVPSRSSFLIGAACLYLIAFPRHWKMSIGVATALLGLAATMFDARLLQDMVSGTRIEGLLVPSEDSSYLERRASLRAGLDVIWSQPLLGTYQFQIDRLGGPGLYVHNILNTWAQAGILPFAVLIGAIVAVAVPTFRRMLQVGVTPEGALLIFAMLSWGYSRTTVSPLLFLCLGVAQFAAFADRVAVPHVDGQTEPPEALEAHTSWAKRARARPGQQT